MGCLRKANNTAREWSPFLLILFYMFSNLKTTLQVLLSSNHHLRSWLTSLWASWPYLSSQLLLHRAVLQEPWSALHGNMFTLTTCPHCFSLTLHLQASQQKRSKCNRTYSVHANVQSEMAVELTIPWDIEEWKMGTRINDSPSVSPVKCPEIT